MDQHVSRLTDKGYIAHRIIRFVINILFLHLACGIQEIHLDKVLVFFTINTPQSAHDIVFFLVVRLCDDLERAPAHPKSRHAGILQIF